MHRSNDVSVRCTQPVLFEDGLALANSLFGPKESSLSTSMSDPRQARRAREAIEEGVTAVLSKLGRLRGTLARQAGSGTCNPQDVSAGIDATIREQLVTAAGSGRRPVQASRLNHQPKTMGEQPWAN